MSEIRLPVFRAPTAGVFILPHGVKARDVETGEDCSLPAGIYVPEGDHRTDEEVRIDVAGWWPR